LLLLESNLNYGDMLNQLGGYDLNRIDYTSRAAYCDIQDIVKLQISDATRRNDLISFYRAVKLFFRSYYGMCHSDITLCCISAIESSNCTDISACPAELNRDSIKKAI
jgi:hypothetical protein